MLDSDHFCHNSYPEQYSEPSAVEQKIIHADLGDLSAPDAFIMNGRNLDKYKFVESTPLYIHLSITGRCQANCKGCINKAFNHDDLQKKVKERVPFQDSDPIRDAGCITHLIKEHPGETVTVCLYGGEPLLARDKILTLIEQISKQKLPNPIRYMLYTNGALLKQAVASDPGMMRTIWLYSVSIDGTREQHENIRRGTNLQQIHEGLEAVKKIRQGPVLMWSTLREEQSLLDCFNEFIYLYDKKLVSQFFWHWVESPDSFHDLAAYADSYAGDLRQIMNFYLEKLAEGKLLPLTHINELVLYLLSGKRRKSTACGVELARNYDIVDGRIHSCADLPPQYAIGTIDATGTPRLEPQDLSWLIGYKNDLGCKKCGVHAYCGGRCPVQAVTGSIERLKQYCQLMRLHVSIVDSYMDEIIAALEKHNLTTQYIYDNSAYYVQFTDGTP